MSRPTAGPTAPRPRASVEALEPYLPGEQPSDPKIIKLNTNEFPYPAAPEVLEAIAAAATDAVRVYPNPTAEPLRRALAEHHGVEPERVFVGNGSDEVLRLLVQAYGGPGRSLACVEPSYSLFPVLAAQFETRLETHPLEGGERLPTSLFDSASDLCMLPVPNPPLGTLFGRSELERLADKPWLLALDGAYVDFSDAGDSTADLLGRANVVVCRTFSKSFGLAGMRLGYLLGPPGVVANLDKLRDSYNVNRVSQAAGLAALGAAEYYRGRCREIVESRRALTRALEEREFQVHPSQGNFVFARHPRAARLYAGLKARGILVRYFDRPGLSDGLRITVGTPHEIGALLAGLDALARAD